VVTGTFHDLAEGAEIEFEVDKGISSAKGPRAARVAAIVAAVR
jgi:cold shock CspA family protein